MSSVTQNLRKVEIVRRFVDNVWTINSPKNISNHCQHSNNHPDQAKRQARRNTDQQFICLNVGLIFCLKRYFQYTLGFD